MIRTLDISNYATPYDTYLTSWPLVSGGWELRAEGLAGGSLSGSVLGQVKTIEPIQIVGQCDFTEGSAVLQIQSELGVPETGYFDETTCVAWYERFGEAPTARSLEASSDASCATIIVPRCSVLDNRSGPSVATMLGVGAAVAAVGLVLISWRRR